MQNSPEIKQFIAENSSLFWYIPEDKKQDIDHEVLVEFILNFGNEKSVRKLFDLLGIDYVADIFIGKHNVREQTTLNELHIISIFTFRDKHTEILTEKQKEILPLIAEFKKDFYLIALGGRAKWKDYVDFNR